MPRKRKRRSARPPSGPEYVPCSKPCTIERLATIYDVERKTMAQWLRSGKVPNLALSRQSYMVDLRSVPQAGRGQLTP
jgi:hypothetical protein